MTLTRNKIRIQEEQRLRTRKWWFQQSMIHCFASYYYRFFQTSTKATRRKTWEPDCWNSSECLPLLPVQQTIAPWGHRTWVSGWRGWQWECRWCRLRDGDQWELKGHQRGDSIPDIVLQENWSLHKNRPPSPQNIPALLTLTTKGYRFFHFAPRCNLIHNL